MSELTSMQLKMKASSSHSTGAYIYSGRDAAFQQENDLQIKNTLFKQPPPIPDAHYLN